MIPIGNQKVYIVSKDTISMQREKKIKLLEESEAFLKVVYWFFAFPTKEISLNDLTEEAGISKTTANKVVKSLEKEGFLRKEVLGKTWRISCNQGHPYNLTVKIPYNFGLVYRSGIIEKIHKKFSNPRAIILFGSYRKGDDVENSDLDIALEVLDDSEIEIYNMGKINLGYRKNIQVNLHIFSRNKIDLNLFSNIANGIVLEGFLEVRP